MSKRVREISHSSSDSDENKEGEKKKEAVLSIKQQWYLATEKTLCSFIMNSPLKNISSNIAPDYYANMSPFLVDEVIRMSNAIDGVKMALQTTIETMNDTCKEATHRILCENGDFKTKQSITLLCETLPMPSATLEQLESDDDLRERLPLQIQHVLSNDRHRKWMAHYRKAGAKTINVFTVKMGPGVAKASAETGRYIVSVLMPFCPANYRLTTMNESYSQSYEELNSVYRKTVIELDSHKRMQAAQDPSNKGAKYSKQEEAQILAGQIQQKEHAHLKARYDEQRMEIAVLRRQLDEMTDVLSTAEQKKVSSLYETIRIVTEKLNQSRLRNVDLFKRLQAAGIKPLLAPLPTPVAEPVLKKRKTSHNVAPIKKQPVAVVKQQQKQLKLKDNNNDDEEIETFAEFKRRKMLKKAQLNKRNTASSTSSSYDEDKEEEDMCSSSFSESGEDISSEGEEEEEDEEEDDYSQ